MTGWIVPPPAPHAVRLDDGRAFPVGRVWCVGRNYAAHAREMGANPGAPVFFTKPARALVQVDEIPYPPHTGELHHEVELVVLLGRGGRDLTPEHAADCVCAWAVGVDLTRRDVQQRAKETGGPWDLAKGFDASAPVGPAVSAANWRPAPEAAIRLEVDGEVRQAARLGDMSRTVPGLLALLSREVELFPGDVLFTGTPAGVGPLAPGQAVTATVAGLPPLHFRIAP